MANILLTKQEKETLSSYLTTKMYPDAYRYAQQIVNDRGGDERLSKWLEIAADINEGDNSFYGSFVRTATKEAGLDEGKKITEDQFQYASDFLAKEVIGGFIKDGYIKDIDYIVMEDVQSVVKVLGLTPEGWAGTFGAWAPFLGLNFDGFWPNLFGDSENGARFYDYLFNDWKKRGVDNFFEKAYKLGTLIDQNLYGLVDGLDVKLGNSLLSILNKMRDVMNALKDPLIIDLKNDGLNLSSPDNRYIESIYFDLNNDGIKEKTGWILPKYEIINSTDSISNGFISNNG